LSDKSPVVSDTAATVHPEAEPRPKAETPSLGAFLASARERRGVSCEDAMRETRIPNHYIRMIESNDYTMISDQIYVLPFLRRYAEFLKLDPEEIAMRFVREVQRADNVPPGRSIEPIEMDRGRPIIRSRGWTRPAIAALVLAALAIAWIAESHHRRAATETGSVNSPSEQNISTR
jgi:cytoskeletal protein RodZ